MKQCDICSGPLRDDNKIGVCRRNAKCGRVRRQRQSKTAAGTEREARRKKYLQAFREATRHDDLTYLCYSPGLGIYKIGHTTNLTRNHQSLRRGCPDIELVTTWPYGIDFEWWLHRKFDNRRITKTEWFKVTEAEVRIAAAEYEKETSGHLG